MSVIVPPGQAGQATGGEVWSILSLLNELILFIAISPLFLYYKGQKSILGNSALNTPNLMSTKKNLLGCFILISLATLFMAETLFTGKMFIPAHSNQFPPWRELAEPPVVTENDRRCNLMMTDVIFMFLPQLSLTREYMQQGDLPVWNPYVLAGVPHIEQNSPACFDPIICFLSFMEPELALGWIAWSHLILSACFTFLFCRTVGLGVEASLLAAITYSFSGWMTTRLHYFQISGASLWLPAIFLGLEKLKNHRIAWFPLISVAVAASFTAGMPQLAIFNFYAGLAYWTVLIAQMFVSGDYKRLKAFIFWCPVSAMLGLGLASAQLIPTLIHILDGEVFRELYTVKQLQIHSLDPISWLVLIVPDLFGYSQWFQSLTSKVIGFRSLLSMMFQNESSNVVEISCYVGIIPLILSTSAVFIRSRPVSKTFFVCLALGSISLVSGTPLIHIFINLPGMAVGDLKRLLYLLVFSLSILTGYSFDTLLKSLSHGKRGFLLMILSIATLLFGASVIILMIGREGISAWLQRCLADFIKIHGYSQDLLAEAVPAVDLQMNVSLIMNSILGLTKSVFVVIISFLILFVSKYRKKIAWLIILLAFIDLILFGLKFNRPMKGQLLYKDVPIADKIGSLKPSSRIIRHGPLTVQTTPFFPNMGLRLGMFDAQGYIALSQRKYGDLWNHMHPDPKIATSVGIYNISDTQIYSSPLLDMMNIGFVLSLEPISAPGIELWDNKITSSFYVYRNPDVLPRLYGTRNLRVITNDRDILNILKSKSFHPAHETVVESKNNDGFRGEKGSILEVEITKLGLDHVEAEVDWGVPGALFRSESFNKNWRATIDGENVQVLRANYAFQAIIVPAGKHEIRFFYDTSTVRWSILISIISLLLTITSGIFVFVRGSDQKSGII